MGWLFGRKKKPKVPFPTGHSVDEGALSFPKVESRERTIEPDKVKQAVGFDKPIAFPKKMPEIKPVPKEFPSPKAAGLQPPPKQTPVSRAQVMPAQVPQATQRPFAHHGPLFVKVDAYQRVLGEIDLLKENLTNLAHYTTKLEQSEFNEDANFVKMKRHIGAMHDKLLQADKILFAQGD